MKVAADKYIIDVSNVVYPLYQKGETKCQQLQKWVQNYASLLERYVHHYPYQCFLFYDVWKEEPDS